MFTTATSIEIEQAITEAEHDALGRMIGDLLGRYKGSTHYVLSNLTEAAAGRVWEYLCDQGVRVTLVRETRITCNANKEPTDG